MKRLIALGSLLSLALLACSDQTAEDDAAGALPPAVALAEVPELPAAERERVVAKLSEALPELEPDAVRGTPVPGIYEIQAGQMFAYVTEDGRYLFAGDLVDLASGVGLTEERRKALRLAMLAQLDDDQVISYAPPEGTPVAHEVWVFTDVDCGYCRKLHREIDTYLERGIKVNYLFFPRTGPGSPSFDKAVSVACADDRKAALTEAKNGGKIEARTCDNRVMDDYVLGQQLGLRGTPMIVLDNGDVVQGYLPAPALMTRLDSEPKADPVAAAS